MTTRRPLSRTSSTIDPSLPSVALPRLGVVLTLLGVTLALLGVTSTARAQEPAGDGPPASSGFQLALRTGYSFPMGKASGSTGGGQSELFGGQVPIIADIGGKPTPNVIIAGYIGFAGGSVGSSLNNSCKTISCSVIGTRLGAEIFYQFAPSASFNPWIGYGIGFERTAISISGGGQTGSVAAFGPEFGHFMVGVDVRLNSTFGVGPFMDLSLAEYTQIDVDSLGSSGSSKIRDKALHEWLTVGAKFTFWP